MRPEGGGAPQAGEDHPERGAGEGGSQEAEGPRVTGTPRRGLWLHVGSQHLRNMISVTEELHFTFHLRSLGCKLNRPPRSGCPWWVQLWEGLVESVGQGLQLALR